MCRIMCKDPNLDFLGFWICSKKAIFEVFFAKIIFSTHFSKNPLWPIFWNTNLTFFYLSQRPLKWSITDIFTYISLFLPLPNKKCQQPAACNQQLATISLQPAMRCAEILVPRVGAPGKTKSGLKKPWQRCYRVAVRSAEEDQMKLL